MFVNHTGDSIFDTFAQIFQNRLYELFAHISHFKIHCYSIKDYQNMENVIPLKEFEKDSFGFAIENKDGQYSSTLAYIIYSPEICQRLQLSSNEICACIAHEVGHIIHHFNTNLKDVNSLLVEMKADEVCVNLGLKENLISTLNKLIISGLYSEEQTMMMKLRINHLNYEASE